MQLAIIGPDEEAAPASTRTYDAWNRLVKVSEGSTTVAEYECDGLNRRIVKSLGTGTVKEHFYFNEDWQELEVRKETSGTISANPFEQFVWHPYYIDALTTRFYDSDVSTGVVQHYFTHDANFNVTAAVDTSGNVVERYDYSPYGEPIFLDAKFDFDADSVSDIAHSRTYTGQRLDTETGLYQYRNRYYHAKLGRFISRDPIGYEGSQWNLYEYVGGRPTISVDPEGLQPCDCGDELANCFDLTSKRLKDCHRRGVAICTLFCKARFPWYFGPSQGFQKCMLACKPAYNLACSLDFSSGLECCYQKSEECRKSGKWPSGVS
ncbi:RHS repeat-associated core domain-containing protein [bacterium]|nr:RHS repeat-associated core domain-containing protein [bacterium]